MLTISRARGILMSLYALYLKMYICPCHTTLDALLSLLDVTGPPLFGSVNADVSHALGNVTSHGPCLLLYHMRTEA
jgi:hypothetical protein